MIDHEESKFDYWDQSIWDRVERNSSIYELEVHEEESVEQIKEYLTCGERDAKLLTVYSEYLTKLLNKLSTARKEEAPFCPSNPQLDQAIQEVIQLTRRIQQL